MVVAYNVSNEDGGGVGMSKINKQKSESNKQHKYVAATYEVTESFVETVKKLSEDMGVTQDYLIMDAVYVYMQIVTRNRNI